MILLLGASGMLGSAIAATLNESEVDYLAPSSSSLDLSDPNSVQEYLEAHLEIEKIINAVAYTDVEAAEIDPEACQVLNVEGLKPLLKAKIPLITFSSDYVFGAIKPGTVIHESFERNPLNQYGRSKLEGEKLLEQSGVPFWNIRTSWLFGPGGNNFVTSILKASEKRDELSIVHDQVGRPTYTKDLAEMVGYHFVLGHPPEGHYHLQNTGPAVSWADFASFFLTQKGWKGTVNKITSDQWPSKVERPGYTVLENTKLKAQMPDWREGVERFLEEGS